MLEPIQEISGRHFILAIKNPNSVCEWSPFIQISEQRFS